MVFFQLYISKSYLLNSWAIGDISNPAYIPNPVLGYSYDMTFKERYQIMSWKLLWIFLPQVPQHPCHHWDLCRCKLVCPTPNGSDYSQLLSRRGDSFTGGALLQHCPSHQPWKPLPRRWSQVERRCLGFCENQYIRCGIADQWCRRRSCRAWWPADLALRFQRTWLTLWRCPPVFISHHLLIRVDNDL